jgi:hypothetical protein
MHGIIFAMKYPLEVGSVYPDLMGMKILGEHREPLNLRVVREATRDEYLKQVEANRKSPTLLDELGPAFFYECVAETLDAQPYAADRAAIVLSSTGPT